MKVPRRTTVTVKDKNKDGVPDLRDFDQYENHPDVMNMKLTKLKSTLPKTGKNL